MAKNVQAQTPGKTFRWAKVWGIMGDEGDFIEGDVVTVRKADGSYIDVVIEAVQHRVTRQGDERLTALVSQVTDDDE